MLHIQRMFLRISSLQHRVVRSHSSLSEGPFGIYKSYLDRNILKPDKRQHQAVVKLQDLYNRVKDYDYRESNKGINTL